MSTCENKMVCGSYVVISANVWDESMPASRRDGLVVEISGKRKDENYLFFSNGTILKFHKSQVLLIS